MSNVGQPESPWLDISLKMAEVVIRQAAPGVVMSAIDAILQSQGEQLEQIGRIETTLEAQMRAPYVGGLNALSDAARATESRKRHEAINKAISKFEDARDLMQARVLEQGPQYLLQKGAAEYQMGNCYTLLGDRKEAGVYFQRAHSSATDYLLAEGGPIRADWNTYRKYADGIRFSPKGMKEFIQSIDPQEIRGLIGPKEKREMQKGALAVGGGAVATVLVLTALGVSTVALPFLAPAAAIPAAIKYLEQKAKEKYTHKVAPALSLIDALRQLQARAPNLDLKFDEPSLTWSTLEEQLSYSQ